MQQQRAAPAAALPQPLPLGHTAAGPPWGPGQRRLAQQQRQQHLQVQSTPGSRGLQAGRQHGPCAEGACQWRTPCSRSTTSERQQEQQCQLQRQQQHKQQHQHQPADCQEGKSLQPGRAAAAAAVLCQQRQPPRRRRRRPLPPPAVAGRLSGRGARAGRVSASGCGDADEKKHPASTCSGLDCACLGDMGALSGTP